MPAPRTALITGITGQDGSYLAEMLLEKGYNVFGFARRESWIRPHAASHLKGRVGIIYGDLAEGVDIADALCHCAPDEIYNLASQSRPGESWARPAETLTINGLSVVRLLEAVRAHCPRARIYHASSSEMFGAHSKAPQNEATAFNATNPYAAAKIYAHQMARIYRESSGLWIACGILFNHESERRPLHFLTQKVAYGAACAALGIRDSLALNEMGVPIVQEGRLALGNLAIARDWGHAPDFVEAMWRMLQCETPDDFVVGTGILHTLEELCATAYDSVGLDWTQSVYSDPHLVRPLETGVTQADARKAENVLGWRPQTDFRTMIERMVKSQIQKIQRAHYLPGTAPVSPAS